MEHHLLALVLRVHTVLASLTELGVKAAPVARVLGEHHPLTHHVQQLVQGWRVRPVAEQGLLRRLTHTLVDQTKLVTRRQLVPEISLIREIERWVDDWQNVISLIKDSYSLIKIGDAVRHGGTKDGLQVGEGEGRAERLGHVEHAA